MKVGVIIPVGPGHELLAEDAKESAAEAFARGKGPFSALEAIVVDDTHGQLGRSAARNRGVSEAAARDCEWVFFLDADDLMHPEAFVSAHSVIDAGYAAVWGAICELSADEESWALREGQLERINGVQDLLGNDPWLTLQMGHFVRRAVAELTPFAEDLDCAEDFDYYYRVWSSHRCIKVREPLFINRRGMHSTGPRSATDAQWRLAVEGMIAERCRSVGYHAEFVCRGERFRFYIDDPFDAIQHCHLSGKFFEQRELEYLDTRLRKGLAVLEVGANVGNHAVYWGRFLKPRRLTLLEPHPVAAALLARNLTANAVAADTSLLGIAAGRTPGQGELQTAQRHNLGAMRLVPAAQGKVRVLPLDMLGLDAVDFMKIDVEGMELDVLAGGRELIARCRPAMLVEVMRENRMEFENWCAREDYRIVHEFPYVYSPNFYIEPNA